MCIWMIKVSRSSFSLQDSVKKLCCTNLSIFHTGTHDMGGIQAVGQDATFDSNICWVWWPDKTSEFGYEADCLDGKAGCRINYHKAGTTDFNKLEDASVLPPFSACSTYAMFELNKEILHLCGSTTSLESDSQCLLTLSHVRQMKRDVSPEYESAKAELFRHRVFGQWSCREC